MPPNRICQELRAEESFLAYKRPRHCASAAKDFTGNALHAAEAVLESVPQTLHKRRHDGLLMKHLARCRSVTSTA